MSQFNPKLKGKALKAWRARYGAAMAAAVNGHGDGVMDGAVSPSISAGNETKSAYPTLVLNGDAATGGGISASAGDSEASPSEEVSANVEQPTSRSHFQPWVEAAGGIAVPLARDASHGTVAGIKAGVFELVPGLSLGLSAWETFLQPTAMQPATTHRMEATAGVNAKFRLGGNFYWYGDAWVGYSSFQTETSTQFRGTAVSSSNFVATRATAGIGYRFLPWLRASVEPLSAAVYLSQGAPILEYSPTASMTLSL